VHGHEPGDVLSARRLPRGRHMRSGDGYVLESAGERRHDLHGHERMRNLRMPEWRVHGNQRVRSARPVPRSWRVRVGDLHESEYHRRDAVRGRCLRDDVRGRRLSVPAERPDAMPLQWGHGLRQYEQRLKQLRHVQHGLRRSRSGWLAQLLGRHVRRVREGPHIGIEPGPRGSGFEDER
jgi:hypothetical protein